MSDRLRVAILGSTGSIGRQALEVAAAHPDRIEVVALKLEHVDALPRNPAGKVVKQDLKATYANSTPDR